ncbi:MAG TPA: hypothetical protein PLF89_16395 [bacterium]|nr:hypothetical protein [bacterium]
MTATTSTSRRQRAESMNALIEAYLCEPGITRQAFCARHQIAYSTFHYHLAKRRRQQAPDSEKSAGRFIPLTLSDSTMLPAGPSACEIVWPGGVVIRFESNPSPEYLAALLQAGSSWR